MVQTDKDPRGHHYGDGGDDECPAAARRATRGELTGHDRTIRSRRCQSHRNPSGTNHLGRLRLEIPCRRRSTTPSSRNTGGAKSRTTSTTASRKRIWGSDPRPRGRGRRGHCPRRDGPPRRMVRCRFQARPVAPRCRRRSVRNSIRAVVGVVQLPVDAHPSFGRRDPGRVRSRRPGWRRQARSGPRARRRRSPPPVPMPSGSALGPEEPSPQGYGPRLDRGPWSGGNESVVVILSDGAGGQATSSLCARSTSFGLSSCPVS